MSRTPREILEAATVVAVVGASRNIDKSAYAIPRQLQMFGFRVIPVNPFAESILGEKSYPTLASIPEKVDLVNVFRPSEDAAEVVRQAIAIGAPAVWLQQGIVSDEGRRLAEEAGIDYVEDRCTGTERALAGIDKRSLADR